jgi:hypothetical protein
LPPGIGIDANTGKISGVPTVAGDYAVVVTVFDGTATDETSFSWTIRKSNKPPVVQTPAHRSSRRGDTVTPFLVVASDPDGDTLKFSADDLPEGVEIDKDSGEISGLIECKDAGTHRVEINVSDGRATTVVTFDWKILENVGPVVKNPGTLTNKPNDVVNYQVEAFEPDHDEMYFSANGLPEGLKINKKTGLISGKVKANEHGTHNVEMLVSDGARVTAVWFKWIIK